MEASSRINQMLGQVDWQPEPFWAPDSCCPTASQAGGLGAGVPLASGRVRLW